MSDPNDHRDHMPFMTPIERQTIDAVKAMFREAAARMAPAMDARPEPEMRDPEIRNLQVAQNTLRLCLEACLGEMHPFTGLTCYELAIRLASYAVSAAPLELQDELLSDVISALPAAHSRRLASGSILRADWTYMGHISPNVPGGRG